MRLHSLHITGAHDFSPSEIVSARRIEGYPLFGLFTDLLGWLLGIKILVFTRIYLSLNLFNHTQSVVLIIWVLFLERLLHGLLIRLVFIVNLLPEAYFAQG